MRYVMHGEKGYNAKVKMKLQLNGIKRDIK